MSYAIEELAPFRWKVSSTADIRLTSAHQRLQVFQVLLLDGENTGVENGSLRDARDLVITDEQFRSFLKRHSHLDCLVPEDNDAMRDSYLLLDEKMRSVCAVRASFVNVDRQLTPRPPPIGSWTHVAASKSLDDQSCPSASTRL